MLHLLCQIDMNTIYIVQIKMIVLLLNVLLGDCCISKQIVLLKILANTSYFAGIMLA